MDEYRQHLIDTYEQLSIGYARTLITLAGGALAISMTFAREIVGPDGNTQRTLLVVAWVLWAIALSLVLCGYYSGRQAAQCAIGQHDEGKLTGDDSERPGKGWAVAVNSLGILSLLSFIVGVFVFVTYVSKTLG